MGCEMNGTIMYRGWGACLRELPCVCGQGFGTPIYPQYPARLNY